MMLAAASGADVSAGAVDALELSGASDIPWGQSGRTMFLVR